MSYTQSRLRLFAGRGFDRSLLEKVVLISLISIIFARILPNTEVRNLTLSIGIAVVIIGNMLVSEFLEQRKFAWRNVYTQFAAMLSLNGLIAVLFIGIMPFTNGKLSRGDLLFFLFLITLLVMLYDMYRPMYRLRLAESDLRVVDNEPLPGFSSSGSRSR